jgi:aminoglycoside phosphotransferase (APT) family kinase protein
VVEALGEASAGLDRWFEYLGDLVDQRAPELGDGLRWLVDHRPTPSEKPVICHGDLWPGNLLVDDGKVVGVLDWTLATVAEPALDVGFTAMAVTIAPLELPQFAVPTVLRISARITRRFVSRYHDLTGADLSNQPWYEALRCLLELTDVVDYRNAMLADRPRQTPRPTWDVCTDRMVDYFRARTGVTLPMPPAVYPPTTS